MVITEEMKEALEAVKEQFQENRDFCRGFAMMAGNDIEVNQTPEQEVEQELNQTRNLGDIVRTSPKNIRESELLTSAQISLSPTEFQSCVNRNASAEEVQNAVNATEVMKEIQQIAALQKEAQRQEEKEREQEQEEVQKEMDQDMMSLGDEYGVMDEIAKSLSEANIVENDGKEITAPQTPSVDTGKDQGIER